MPDDKFWTTPMGLFLDLWACYKQHKGIEKPYREEFIDDIW